MNQNDLASVVDLIAAADGRNVSEQTYGAWFLVLGHLDFRLARDAALEAMRDDTIRWVEPKHVLAKVGKIRDRRDADMRRDRALSEKKHEEFAPVPICVDHGLSINKCEACGRKALALSRSLDGVDGPAYQKAFWGTICMPQ